MGLIVPKRHVTFEAEETRTEPEWAYCVAPAWYGLTAREWYKAKTTDPIQSVLLSAAAGWWGGRIIIIEALFQLAHPTPASLSLNFTSGAVCPHTSKS